MTKYIKGNFILSNKWVFLKKVDNLWLESNPSVLAYYKLKGIKVEESIVCRDYVVISSKKWYCGSTTRHLIEFRKLYPSTTKEEFIQITRGLE